MVGPDYSRPKVSLNTTWGELDDERLGDSAVDPEWWKSFHDPILDELVELACRDNLTLQVAGLRIFEARAVLGIANADQWPKNVEPIASGFGVGMVEHTANGTTIDRYFAGFQVGFDAVWELDFWGKYRRGVRAAHADYLAFVADYDQALVSLTAEVARTYVQIRTFEELIAQGLQNVALQEEARRIAEARWRNGATSELDVMQASNLLETTRASIPKLRSGMQQAQNALSTLLARPTGSVKKLLSEPRGIPALPETVDVSAPAELLRRRPDIRGAELRAVAQCERIGVAKADLYPSFRLNGSIGAGAAVGTHDAAALFSPGSLLANVGASVFWPILDYPRILDNMRVEDARYQQALITYVSTVLTAAQEVDDGITGYLRQQDAVVFEQKAVEAAQTGLKLALTQYNEGAVDYQRVLDTQRVLLESQNAVIGSRSQAATNLIALYKALGGGWEVRAGAPVVKDMTRRQMEKRTDWGSHFRKQQGPGDKTPEATPASRATGK